MERESIHWPGKRTKGEMTVNPRHTLPAANILTMSPEASEAATTSELELSRPPSQSCWDVGGLYQN